MVTRSPALQGLKVTRSPALQGSTAHHHHHLPQERASQPRNSDYGGGWVGTGRSRAERRGDQNGRNKTGPAGKIPPPPPEIDPLNTRSAMCVGAPGKGRGGLVVGVANKDKERRLARLGCRCNCNSGLATNCQTRCSLTPTSNACRCKVRIATSLSGRSGHLESWPRSPPAAPLPLPRAAGAGPV